MPTSLKILTAVAKFTTELTYNCIISCNDLEERLSLFDTLFENFKCLQSESAELATQEKLQFKNIIEQILTDTLNIQLSLMPTSLDKEAINILAFSTVMQFLSSTPEYIHFFQNKHATFINRLNHTSYYATQMKNTAIQQHALIGLACFCHIMHSQTKLLYFKAESQYYLFFHNEIDINRLIKKLIDLKKERPDLTHHIDSSLHEIARAYTSLSHAQLMLQNSKSTDRKLLASIIHDIKVFIKQYTHEFFEEKLGHISTTESLHQFNHIYTSLIKTPHKHSEGKAQLQAYIAQQLILELDKPQEQDFMWSVFYNIVGQDSAWPHIASIEAKNMQDKIREVITKTKGFQTWMYNSMQTQVRSPILFCIPTTNQLNNNTISPPNSLDADAHNP